MEESAKQQLRNLSTLPFIHKHIAALQMEEVIRMSLIKLGWTPPPAIHNNKGDTE